MASAPHAPPQQRQTPPRAAAPRPASPNSLDNLQAMINMVLIQSGQFFKEQRAGTASRRQEHSLKKIVPAGIDRFQDSLDELESELQQAQAVLRRDLALLQAGRQQREAAEAAERQRLAAASSAQQNAVHIIESPAGGDMAAAVKPTGLADGAIKADSERRPSESHSAEEPPPPISTTAAPAADPLFDGTPTTANAQDSDFDFDAMFGESAGDAGAGADNPSNADNTKGADLEGDIDMDAPAPDLNFSLDESGPTLLAGLDEFAKSGNDNAPKQGENHDMDFAMPDLPDLQADQPSEPPHTTQPADTSTTQQPTADAEDEDMLQPMATDELDDLFNMDYENAETTEFDNAFFFD